MWSYRCWKNSYNFHQYDYNLIYNVYNSVRKNSRLILVLRHAERWSDYWEEWWLTQNWIKQAKVLWKRLTWWIFADTNLDLYYATWYKRTPETSFYVWYGRWYRSFQEDISLFKKNWRNYDKIIKGIDVLDPYYFAYDMWFEELNKKSVQFINRLCKLTEWHPFCFITSHDHLVVPLITWISGWLIKFSVDKWVNYLSWVAVIINETTKTWEVYPVRTLIGKSIILDDPWDFGWVLCSTITK